MRKKKLAKTKITFSSSNDGKGIAETMFTLTKIFPSSLSFFHSKKYATFAFLLREQRCKRADKFFLHDVNSANLEYAHSTPYNSIFLLTTRNDEQ